MEKIKKKKKKKDNSKKNDLFIFLIILKTLNKFTFKDKYLKKYISLIEDNY